MKSVRLYLEKNKIVIQINEEKREKNVFLLHWIAAYIFNYIMEKDSSSKHIDGMQDAVEEYCFNINNADVEDDIVIPDIISNDIRLIIDEILHNDCSSIDFSLGHLVISKEELSVIYDLIFDDFLKDLVEVYSDCQVELYINEFYGKCFYDYIVSHIKDNGNSIITANDNKELKQIKLYYNNKVVFDLERDYEDARELVICNSLSGFIELKVVDDNNNSRNIRLCFPIWKTGDVLKIFICIDNENTILVGEHLNTGIVSKVVL